MSDATTEFFDQLSRHGHQRLLKKTTATVRFDIEHDHGTDHWFVAIANGDLSVSKENRQADTVISMEQVLFERLVRGEARPVSAWLRNDIASEGSLRNVVLLERLFPQPPGAHHPRAFARERSRSA